MKKDEQILVTQPVLPPLNEFIPLLEDIWDSKWLTNNGKYHKQLEAALAEYLKVPYISLFSNGTLALITAIQALKITGEVITTPYSFVATTHALWWNNIKPIFVDIEPDFLNINPEKIEAAITPRTTAIIPVHVYGNPCKVDEIKKIADVYGLKIIYDAAHAFGVQRNNQSILNYGDLSILSFHATKVYNTIEGGAIISHDKTMKKRIDYLKNFGFEDEVNIVTPGFNAKMNEVQAAYGLLQLKTIDSNIKQRQKIVDEYKKLLADIDGISFFEEIPNVKHNYAYFPIFVNKDKYGTSRDDLYNILKDEKIYARRYFYPLISQFPIYKTERFNSLAVAEKVTEEVICLPIYPELSIEDVKRICSIIKNK
ncbi:MAG: DegT/DnrJ/EryC1/StrS family aminotransferase [Bacteroidales bacterium]|nr:DegT/DnrJ/EryC1/StrS family aminotransferase [Bacteroidales bacterium]